MDLFVEMEGTPQQCIEVNADATTATLLKHIRGLLKITGKVGLRLNGPTGAELPEGVPLSGTDVQNNDVVFVTEDPKVAAQRQLNQMLAGTSVYEAKRLALRTETPTSRQREILRLMLLTWSEWEMENSLSLCNNDFILTIAQAVPYPAENNALCILQRNTTVCAEKLAAFETLLAKGFAPSEKVWFSAFEEPHPEGFVRALHARSTIPTTVALKAIDAQNDTKMVLAALSGLPVKALNMCLAQAAVFGDANKTEFLLNKGADPNARQLHGNTLFMIACKKMLVEVAAVLVKHGADVHAQNTHGTKAIDHIEKMRLKNVRTQLMALFKTEG